MGCLVLSGSICVSDVFLRTNAKGLLRIVGIAIARRSRIAAQATSNKVFAKLLKTKEILA
jgi:hypothetical protein